MAKRRLTKQQVQRIAARRKAKRELATEIDENQLGPTQEGLVIRHFGTQAEVEPKAHTDTAPSAIRCHLRANLGDLATGDTVLWREGDPLGVVESVLPRQTELLRPDSYGKLKIVAANVTQAIITIAPEPEPHANLIDRYLVAIHALNITPILVLNKCDLAANTESLPRLTRAYTQLGYPVLKVSAKNNEGMGALKDALSSGTSIFVGQSGVGKSSLIQALLPKEDIKIGELSEAVKKGRHTTTHASLYHFEFGGHCIDSPGIREFGLWHLTAEEVLNGFKELQSLAEHCKFRDCSHTHEPGCALLKALDEQVISEQRFKSYQQIIHSLDDVDIIPKP